MRLIVFFDLPVQKAEQRKNATKFRKYLIDDGFYMMQFSVYSRLCATRENADVHLSRLKKHLPPQGSVRVMIVTEKQYANIEILVGRRKKKDKKILDNQLSIF